MNSSMKIVTVIPLQKGPLRGDLTYFSAKDIPLGSIVSITVRNKKVLGLVAESEDVRDAKSDIKEMSFNLKKIVEVKERSIFRTEYLQSVVELSRYFATTKNNTVASLIPSLFREEYDKIAKFHLTPSPSPWQGEGSQRPGEVRPKSEKLLLQEPLEDRISIYKTLIRENFALKKSVFIVLPTEHDIKIFEESLGKGIEQFTFTIHGGLSKKKAMQKLENIITNPHGVLILGTAPYLSIPRHDIGVIIVEHESSTAYKMITRPHLDLRVFVELFASKINTKLILGDTLLRFETISKVEIEGFIPMHPLSFRINFDGEIKIENPREKTDALLPSDGSKASVFRIFSDEGIKEIQAKLDKKKNVFIFSLRKGLATMTVCRDCSEIVSCEKCSAPLVLYLSNEGKKRMFVCNRCAEEKDGDVVCKTCGSWNLILLGIGTDTVLEELIASPAIRRRGGKNEPATKILKLDKEIAKTAKGAEKIIKEFESGTGSILVGTEMALFYLQEEVPLSIIASFDSLWSIPSFRMSEKIIQLIISIISKTKDKFIIQTKNENDPAILAIKSGNLLSFVREELSDRKTLGYPPFKRFIKITHLGDKEQAIRARSILKEIFQEYEPEIFSGFVAKLQGKYTTNALIKLDPKKWSLPELSENSSIDETLLQKLLSLSSLSPSFQVFVDPEDLL